MCVCVCVCVCVLVLESPSGSVGKVSVCSAGDLAWFPLSGQSPEEEKKKMVTHSSLENPMDRRAWWAIVHRVTRLRHNLVTNHHHH